MAKFDKRSKLFETAPEEVVRYFDQKVSRPSFDWRDVAPGEHATAYTVAKTAGYDVLDDLRDATRKAVVDRVPFDKFREDLEPTLIRKGWWGKRSAIDPLTGKTVTVQLGSPRRLKTIYWANARAAHAAGEWERTQRTKDFLPFLIYTLSTAELKRPLHAEWARKPVVLPVDDDWWKTHYPPNGWLCQCGVRQITRREAVSRGWVPDTSAPPIAEKPWVNKRTGVTEMIPDGIDPGWQTNPGRERARRMMDLMAERIAEAPEDAARAMIADLWASPVPKTYAKMPERVWMPAGYVPDLAERFGAKSPLVSVSGDTIAAKVGKHAVVGLDDFAKVQQILDEGIAIDRGRGDIAFWLQRDDASWLVAAVKKSDKGFLYLSTLFGSSTSRHLKLIERYGVWKR